MRKKLFTLLLAVAAGVGTMFADGTKIGDLYYNLNATEKTAEVTYELQCSVNNYKWLTTANIPASVTYNSVTYSVTSIGEWAFSGCSGLTSVTIPNSVTSIGDDAFYNCTGLTFVTIPNSVTSIGGGAFQYCYGLTSVTIPNSVTSIGEAAFAFTGLTSVTIPNSVTSIGDDAFEYCAGLTSVTIGNSVTSIGNDAFRECSSLISIDVASDNSNYCSVDGVLFNKDKTTLIQYPGGKQGAYTIPNSVTSIGSWAFRECTGLTSVTIGNSVTSIGDIAFYGCTGLTSVTIGNSVTYIGQQAFAGCTSLTSVTIGNSVTGIGEGAFYGCTGLTSVTIGNSVTSIGDGAFWGCSSLASIIVENGNSFYDSRNNCNAIIETATNTLIVGCKNTIIPNSVTSIGGGAFIECTGLTSVTIPNSVTSIGDGAFYGCRGLTSVTIPNSVNSIGDRAFRYCYGLTSVTCFATTPPQLDSYDVFEEVDKSIPLYVPAGSVSAYQSADVWKYFTNILPIGAQPADVTTTTVTPSETTADIAWPQVTDAATYTIEIKKNGELICTLTFNAQGQLISIASNAPSRNNAPQRAQAAGFSFTVTSLDSGTTYSYTMTAKDNNDNVLKTESGSFTTTGESQGIEDVQGNEVQSKKFVRNGQIYILRGDRTYTLTGVEVK